MADTVHTYVRKRGSTDAEPVELHYSANGRGLQRDLAALTGAGLPQPDLVRGRLVLPTMDDAVRALRLGLHGVFTREVPVDDPALYERYPELIGPPKIQLRQPRPPRQPTS